ncbi:MAG: hypothetical protein IJA77_07805 [Clostridia bacterium]|nr:hypothetical protein [Clostridia bacterium]
MKYVWMVIRLLLPVAAIVLLGLYITGVGGESKMLLMGGLLCSTAGLWLNIWFQRRERKEKQ